MFSGDSLQKLKNSLKTIVNKLYKINNEKGYYTISIKVYGSSVGGNGKTNTILPNATLDEAIDFLEAGGIERVQADGGNFEREAIAEIKQEWKNIINKKAKDMTDDEETENIENQENIDFPMNKFTILLTDGGIDLGPGHEESLGALRDSFIYLMSEYDDMYFLTYYWSLAYKDICEQCLTLDNRGFIIDIGAEQNLEQAIPQLVISAVKDGEIKQTKRGGVIKKGFFETDYGYSAIMDEELVYGSTLTVDYSIHIKANESLRKINITDYLPQGMQCISCSHNFTLENNTLKFSIAPDTWRDETVISMTLSKILSSADDVQELENTADIEVIPTYGTPVSTFNANEKIVSGKLSIIPPFGSKEEKLEIISVIKNHWKFILLTIIWIMVAIYFIKQIKIFKNK